MNEETKPRRRSAIDEGAEGKKPIAVGKFFVEGETVRIGKTDEFAHRLGDAGYADINEERCGASLICAHGFLLGF